MVCRFCGCTDTNCLGCIARTGQPCHWVRPHLCSACDAGFNRILVERSRQQGAENFLPESDDRYVHRELRHAAACYAMPPALRKMQGIAGEFTVMKWPWNPSWWKPTPDDRPRELEKAGALFLAESERLLRRGNVFTSGLMACKAKACGRKIDRILQLRKEAVC